MKRATLSTIVLYVLLVSTYAANAQESPLRLGQAREITSSVSLYKPINLEVGPDGAVFVGDSGAQQIIKLSPEGEVIWRVGHEGQGPGEFRLLYRIAVGQDGSVVAFDMGTQDLSWFGADGTFIRRVNLAVRVYAVGSIELLPDGRVAMLAYVPSANRNSIHVFDTAGEHVDSFAPLPPAQDEQQLREWPAGFLEASGSDLIFTLNLPYEIHRFSYRGELLESIRRDYEFTEEPAGGDVAIAAGERLRYLGPPGFVPHPLGAKDLGDGWLLGGVLTAPDASIWDLFHDGELVASFPAPNGWLTAADIDPQRRVLYVKSGNADGDPIYLQVPYTLDTSVVRGAIEGRE